MQAEIYRTYHMTDPEAFFNKEDLWDLARGVRSAGGTPAAVPPTYIIASLPDSDESEFLLMTTFTPRGKDNLTGIMIARCDGERLGELVFLQLSKQALIYGPLQVEAQINQDQNISKDLSLWNQQGSEVIRGNMLVLPVENTLLYIQPIYLQSSSAKMPQLKKVIVSNANRLIYADSYEEALARMRGESFAARKMPLRCPCRQVRRIPRLRPESWSRSGISSGGIANFCRKASLLRPARRWKK